MIKRDLEIILCWQPEGFQSSSFGSKIWVFKLYKHATPSKIRAEIQAAPASISDSELARLHGVGDSAFRRWRYPDDDVHDRPYTRHNLLAMLTPEQEDLLIACKSVPATRP